MTIVPIRGIGRGIRDHPRAKVRPLAEIWARRLTGKFNKDIKLFLVGPQGSGKSRSALHLAMRVAEEESKILKKPWETFFPRDLSNVYIGDPQAHADALKHIQRNGVYILDDAGVSINARNFMTSYNKSLNDIFQTIRTDNALIIINAPDTFLIDNVPRNIVSYFGEVSESQHSAGMNFVKIFKMERKFRSGETHYHYYQFGNDQVIRWRFRDIPEDMVALYEKRRDEATQMIKSNAGKPREEKKRTLRAERNAQIEDACVYAYELLSTNPGATKRSCITKANQKFPTAFVSDTTFTSWMIKHGY